MTRFLEITYNWPAETFIQRHARALQAIQFPLHLVARHNHRLLAESASLGGLDVNLSAEVMPNFNHLGWAGKLASLRFLTAKSIRRQGVTSLSEKTLLGYFERLRPDLIHFHDASLAALMCWIPRSLKVPYTLSIRGSDVQVLPHRSSVQKNAIASAIEGARKIHAVCHELGLTAEKLIGHELDFSVIYTTLPIPESLPAWKGPVNGEKIHLVSIGRIMWSNGLPDLLISLRRLLDIGERVRLTIVGTGPELDHILYIRKILALESAVVLTGKLDYSEIKLLLSGAHGYIQASVAEGLSNSLVEAMVNGLPVFATDVGGTKEVIEDGITGFLLLPLCPELWPEKLINIRDVALMEKIRNSAFQKAREYFSSGQHANAFVSFYQEALQNPN